MVNILWYDFPECWKEWEWDTFNVVEIKTYYISALTYNDRALCKKENYIQKEIWVVHGHMGKTCQIMESVVDQIILINSDSFW